MILPFSSRRSRTSLSSNCLYCASLTPRAMFSKSMNMASLRSPFITLLSGRRLHYMSICPGGRASGKVYSEPHGQADRPRAGGSGAARPAPDREVARAHLRDDAALRPRPLDLPLLRPRRARALVDVGGISGAAAGAGALGHPL